MTAALFAVAPMNTSRNTIFVEDAELLSVQKFAGEQFVQRYSAPKCARTSTAGSFIHAQCDPSIPMRRPLSIMRASVEEGWIEILFKVVGSGLCQLGQKKPGSCVNVIGPIGQGFVTDDSRPRRLLIGGGVGIPPMVFLAEQILQETPDRRPIVLMGSEIPFPFNVTQSKLEANWVPADINGSMPLLEDWGIVCRLASLAGLAGAYQGYVTDLARQHLDALTVEELGQTELFACGPTPMLKAVAALAEEFDLPCQVSLEEFMACAVGGCAGCAVPVMTDGEIAMKRVCVDGPVFQASTVFFDR